MNKMIKDSGKVLSFTLARGVETKSYKITTAVIAIICFLVPAMIFFFIGWSDSNYSNAVDTLKVSEVTVVDKLGKEKHDFDIISSIGGKYKDVKYTVTDDINKVTKSSDFAVVIEADSSGTLVSVLTTDYVKHTNDEAIVFSDYLKGVLPAVMFSGDNLSPEELSLYTAPVTDNFSDTSEAESSDSDGLFFITIYLNIMILYFMILLYGQGVASSVISEKTSKLLDLMLISVKPGAMIVGKVIGTALTGIIQFFIWVAALFSGIAVGIYTSIAFFPSVADKYKILSGLISGLITPRGIFALLILIAGFLLYCSLASIGGSLAGKPEDLGSTNIFFTATLVISFFAVLSSMDSASYTGIISWIPFTSVLILPGLALLGKASVLTLALSLTITIVCDILLMLLAGKVYKMMAFYKGNAPKPSMIFSMIKQKKTEN